LIPDAAADALDKAHSSTALWALIPVKPFGEGKSRLAEHLRRDQRAALSRLLLSRLLEATTATGCFAGRVVVSRDPEVLAMAAAAAALPLPEEAGELNAALEQARACAVKHGADAVLVLPADLPNVTATALREVIEAARDAAITPNVLIVPSTTQGTNALLLQPPEAIPFAFGPESATRHAELATDRDLEVLVFPSIPLAVDVDLPDDLSPDLAIMLGHSFGE